jgi:hypothetical protein
MAVSISKTPRMGLRFISMVMVNLATIESHFSEVTLHRFSFHPRLEEPVRTIICHFLKDTPAEYISTGLAYLGFNVLNVENHTLAS